MSLALFDTVGTRATDVGERHFRFTVRCDRAFSHRIERAARVAGMSVTAFVQAHFDTIIDEPADASGFSPDAFARRHDVSVQAARLWKAMIAAVDDDGLVTAAARDLAGPAKISQGHARDYLAELRRVGLVVMVHRPISSTPGTYRVVRP